MDLYSNSPAAGGTQGASKNPTPCCGFSLSALTGLAPPPRVKLWIFYFIPSLPFLAKISFFLFLPNQRRNEETGGTDVCTQFGKPFKGKIKAQNLENPRICISASYYKASTFLMKPKSKKQNLASHQKSPFMCSDPISFIPLRPK